MRPTQRGEPDSPKLLISTYRLPSGRVSDWHKFDPPVPGPIIKAVQKLDAEIRARDEARNEVTRATAACREMVTELLRLGVARVDLEDRPFSNAALTTLQREAGLMRGPGRPKQLGALAAIPGEPVEQSAVRAEWERTDRVRTPAWVAGQLGITTARARKLIDRWSALPPPAEPAGRTG